MCAADVVVHSLFTSIRFYSTYRSVVVVCSEHLVTFLFEVGGFRDACFFAIAAHYSSTSMYRIALCIASSNVGGSLIMRSSQNLDSYNSAFCSAAIAGSSATATRETIALDRSKVARNGSFTPSVRAHRSALDALFCMNMEMLKERRREFVEAVYGVCFKLREPAQRGTS